VCRIDITTTAGVVAVAFGFAGCPFGNSSSGCIADLLPDLELPGTDLDDDVAAAPVAAAWPVSLPQVEHAATKAFFPAAHSSSGGSGSWSAADANGRQQVVAQQHMLQHPVASMSCSPSRPAGSTGDAMVGLKSPEALPW
jgi:hypothetical protein